MGQQHQPEPHKIAGGQERESRRRRPAEGPAEQKRKRLAPSGSRRAAARATGPPVRAVPSPSNPHPPGNADGAGGEVCTRAQRLGGAGRATLRGRATSRAAGTGASPAAPSPGRGGTWCGRGGDKGRGGARSGAGGAGRRGGGCPGGDADPGARGERGSRGVLGRRETTRLTGGGGRGTRGRD